MCVCLCVCVCVCVCVCMCVCLCVCVCVCQQSSGLMEDQDHMFSHQMNLFVFRVLQCLFILAHSCPNVFTNTTERERCVCVMDSEPLKATKLLNH